MSQAENHTAQLKSENNELKSVYFFASGEAEGEAKMKNILGGKGANLAEMTALGLPVPPGFTISTSVCKMFFDSQESLPEAVRTEVLDALKRVEGKIGKKFGDVKDPLLVSVRSGARVSMPGMMDTILNLGLNDETVEGLAKGSGQARFAWDSYRRFLQMYSNVVMGMNSSLLEVVFEDLKREKNVEKDTDLGVEDLKRLVGQFKNEIMASTGLKFPSDVHEQLWGAIQAVFKSWNIPRAITYRRLNNIPGDWGTAVNVQAMVFGNMGEDSATGVAFTRDPSTGEKIFYGEFLINAQGEDVVAGIRTPQPLTRAAAKGKNAKSLEELLPGPFQELEVVYKKLEQHYHDMQDIEFTIERGHLWMLQTRNGKRTAQAALKVAMDMIDEKLLDEKEALLRIEPKSLEQLLHPTLDPDSAKQRLAKGLPASPGGAGGQIVFSSEDAVEWVAKGKKVILVRVETSPEDIEGMECAEGVLTARGGMTSHAAVVARGMGRCCVAGCDEIDVDYHKKELRAPGHVLYEGDYITLDGASGEVFLGEVKTVEAKLDGDFDRLMSLSDKYRKLGIRSNADTPEDALVARKFGAEGIGLTRTEHMFFGADRIDVVREMIMANGPMERREALNKLFPMQRQDFAGILKAMEGQSVTIRLLDPPLHEFLPHNDKEAAELAARLNWDEGDLKAKVKSLHEFNPMLGHRGCRLAITYPEIYEMQVRALAEATLDVMEENPTGKFLPEIMIPLIATRGEFTKLRTLVDQTVKAVQEQRGKTFEYLVGTMIELPRAALVADQIAETADFFSFGTNDLTQTCLGISRDDAGRFLGSYINEKLLANDPFATIDKEGVGQLVTHAVKMGRLKKPGLKLGICGEHGGDPESIEFFHSIGLDYVSCSPYRVPVARLAAAQVAILEEKKKP